jgi:hypothetical protein
MPTFEWPRSFPALGILIADFDWDQPIPDPPSTRGHGVGAPQTLPRQTADEYHVCPTCGSGNTEHSGNGGPAGNTTNYRNCRNCGGRYAYKKETQTNG